MSCALAVLTVVTCDLGAKDPWETRNTSLSYRKPGWKCVSSSCPGLSEHHRADEYIQPTKTHSKTVRSWT